MPAKFGKNNERERNGGVTARARTASCENTVRAAFVTELGSLGLAGFLVEGGRGEEMSMV